MLRMIPDACSVNVSGTFPPSSPGTGLRARRGTAGRGTWHGAAQRAGGNFLAHQKWSTARRGTAQTAHGHGTARGRQFCRIPGAERSTARRGTARGRGTARRAGSNYFALQEPSAVRHGTARGHGAARHAGGNCPAFQDLGSNHGAAPPWSHFETILAPLLNHA